MRRKKPISKVTIDGKTYVPKQDMSGAPCFKCDLSRYCAYRIDENNELRYNTLMRHICRNLTKHDIYFKEMNQ